MLVYDVSFVQDEKPTFPTGVRQATLSEIAKTDILFLCVPISQIEHTCKEISPLLAAQTIVVDVCSVKVYPVKIMLETLSPTQPIIATHPLFGPDSVARLGLPGRKVIFSPIRATTEQALLVRNIFEKLELVIIETTPDNHDQQMARSQALVHFLGRAFADLKLTEQEISTPNYESLLRIHDLVNNDTWELFFDMQRHNPYASSMRSTLRKSLADLEERIRVSEESLPLNEGTFMLRRSMIDNLDSELIKIIAHRIKIGRSIQEYKKSQGLPVTDLDREDELTQKHNEWVQKTGIENSTLIKEMFKNIISEVKHEVKNAK